MSIHCTDRLTSLFVTSAHTRTDCTSPAFIARFYFIRKNICRDCNSINENDFSLSCVTSDYRRHIHLAHPSDEQKKTPNLKKSHVPRVTLAFRIWTLSSTNFLFHKAYSLWCFRCARQFWGCLAVVLVQKHGKTLILLEEGERTNDFICYCRWFWHNRMFFPSLISVYWIK